MPQRHLASPHGLVPRRDHLEPVAEAVVDQLDEQAGQRQRARAASAGRPRRRPRARPPARTAPAPAACPTRAEHARRGLVAQAHLEGPCMTHPAGDRLAGAARAAVGDVHVARGAGTAVEVLVGAARRRSRRPPRRGRPGSLRPSGTGPTAPAPRRRGRPGSRLQVEHRPRAEVHVRQRQQGDVLVERGDGIGRVAPAQRRRRAGRPPRPRRSRRWGRWSARSRARCGPGRIRIAATIVLNSRTLVESPTCTAAAVGPDQPGDLRRDPPREVHPAGVVPGPDQPGRPTPARPPRARGRRTARRSAPSELPSR